MYKSLATVAALTSAYMADTVEARWSFGSCPKVENVSDFDPARYSGQWYEIVRDRQNPYTLSTDCVTKEFAPYNEQDKSMDLYFRGYYMWRFGYMGASGTMYQCDEGSADSFTCMATMGRSPKRSPFPIWATDYDNYDIGYSCTDHLGGRVKFEMFSVASRTPEMSDEVMAQVSQIIEEKIPHYNLDKARGLYWTKQNGWCEYSWKWAAESETPSDSTGKFLL